MPLTVLSGSASNFSQSSDLSYAATNNGPVAIANQIFSFRLDNKPVFYRTRTLVSIGDGDQVAAAGTEKQGTLQALAVRNLSTGATYHAPTTVPMILSALLILVGIPLIAFLGIGLFFVGFGAFLIYKCLNVRKATALLAALPLAARA